MAAAKTVDAFLAALDADTLALVNALRALIVEADSGLNEEMKWNAPSFSDKGEDRITLGLERRGGVRLVLHRGAKVISEPFHFDDPGGLAKWPAPDRGVLVFADQSDLDSKTNAVADIVRRWIAATREPQAL